MTPSPGPDSAPTTRMCLQSQAGTSTFWLDVVGSWWLEVPEGASVALGVRTPKGG